MVQAGPWREARGSLPPAAVSDAEIPPESMRDYYMRTWREAVEDNAAIQSPPAFTGSIDEFERLLSA